MSKVFHRTNHANKEPLFLRVQWKSIFTTQLPCQQVSTWDVGHPKFDPQLAHRFDIILHTRLYNLQVSGLYSSSSSVQSIWNAAPLHATLFLFFLLSNSRPKRSWQVIRQTGSARRSALQTPFLGRCGEPKQLLHQSWEGTENTTNRYFKKSSRLPCGLAASYLV